MNRWVIYLVSLGFALLFPALGGVEYLNENTTRAMIFMWLSVGTVPFGLICAVCSFSEGGGSGGPRPR